MRDKDIVVRNSHIVIKYRPEIEYSKREIQEAQKKFEMMKNSSNYDASYHIDKNEMLEYLIQEASILKTVLLSLDYNSIKIDKNRLVESMEKIEIYQLLINYLQKELDINKNDNGKIYQKKKIKNY